MLLLLLSVGLWGIGIVSFVEALGPEGIGIVVLGFENFVSYTRRRFKGREKANEAEVSVNKWNVLCVGKYFPSRALP